MGNPDSPQPPRNIRMQQRAKQNLKEIEAYIGNDSVQAARQQRKKIMARIRSLMDAPRRGRPAETPAMKQLGVRIIAEGWYHIYYLFDSSRNEILILHIRHGARKPVEIQDLFETEPTEHN